MKTKSVSPQDIIRQLRRELSAAKKLHDSLYREAHDLRIQLDEARRMTVRTVDGSAISFQPDLITSIKRADDMKTGEFFGREFSYIHRRKVVIECYGQIYFFEPLKKSTT